MQKIADIYLFDIVENLPQGTALDISQALAGSSSNVIIKGGNDFQLINDSDIVVITAGLPRKPGMSRLDLLNKNIEIVKPLAKKVANCSPNAIILTVTNPLDIITYVVYQFSGFPSHKVIGMGGLLDSYRMKYFLSQAAQTAPELVNCMVIGTHGPKMVPLISQARINNQPVEKLLNSTTVATVIEKTRKGGAEIVSYLKNSSAFYAPALAITTMVKAIVKDESLLISACCMPNNQYELSEIYINLPVILGAGGIKEIVELPISKEERQALQVGAEEIKSTLKQVFS